METSIVIPDFVDARIGPRGSLENLSQAEIEKLLDSRAGGLYQLFRKCALAVMPPSKPVLELNVEHHLVKYLEKRANEDEFSDLALVLFEQATLAEGAQLPDPGAFVQRLNKLWMRLE